MQTVTEFSFRTRRKALNAFRTETFDVLVIGGGITGATVARDAAYRGLKVALVDKNDFAFGTSSRSSKLIHGGLRYLENMEFKLVFEALSERALLLKTAPHLVRPLPFYFPVYEGAKPGLGLLSLGMWLYDSLSLFRTPGFHKRLNRMQFVQDIPFLNSKSLKGGFRYYDASMWDDRMVIEVLRSASEEGVQAANYVEAVSPIWDGDKIEGFKVRDRLEGGEDIHLQAKHIIVCAGPWTDEVGGLLGPAGKWRPVLKPSLGIHLVFDWTRIPLPGAVVMAHPLDGRISFVMPRRDLGPGVTIVGTTDTPAPKDIGTDIAPQADIRYLLDLLNQFFPSLALKDSDILSHYVGVRPLVHPYQGESVTLQKVSREHHIDRGPGGVVWAAGGKYTTARTMAAEIVEFTLKDTRYVKSTQLPFNQDVTHKKIRIARENAQGLGLVIDEKLWEEYGAEALEIAKSKPEVDRIVGPNRPSDPPGFPLLLEQCWFHIRHGMVLKPEDFIRRRVPLHLARGDQGKPWREAIENLIQSFFNIAETNG